MGANRSLKKVVLPVFFAFFRDVITAAAQMGALRPPYFRGGWSGGDGGPKNRAFAAKVRTKDVPWRGPATLLVCPLWDHFLAFEKPPCGGLSERNTLLCWYS